MSRPRRHFRRIVVEGQPFDWRLVCRDTGRGMTCYPDFLAVREAGHRGQRLRVRFGYAVWHFVGGRPQYPTPALVERLLRDAWASGWEPRASGRPDFEWDGRAYLAPVSESVYG